MSTLLELAAFVVATVATRRGFGVTAAEYVGAAELLYLSVSVDDSAVRRVVTRRVGRFVVRRARRRVESKS